MHPPNTFLRPVELGFVCSETHPRNGATALKSKVILGGNRRVTEGMRQWSVLGWYEMATFAIIRARCCQDPPPLRWPLDGLGCPLDDSLVAVAALARAYDDEQLERVAKQYYETARCLVSHGQAHAFGQKALPRGGELSGFKRFLERTSR